MPRIPDYYNVYIKSPFFAIMKFNIFNAIYNVMRKSEKVVREANTSLYANIPWYLAEDYRIKKGQPIKYDKSDPRILKILIRRGKN